MFSQKISVFLFFFILFFCFTCKSPKSSEPAAIQAVYIDPTAAAGGDGTLSKPYKYWADVSFKSGCSYLQKRGTIAREQILLNASGVILSDYGSGALPLIQGSELETGWALESGSVYKKVINVGLGDLGMAAEDGVALKFLEWKGNFSSTFSGASSGAFSFNPADKTFYVWCSDNANPDTHNMEISKRLYGIHGDGVSNIQIKNLQIRYASLHGIQFENSSFISIENCVIEKSGGAVISPVPLLYAGNGIEFGDSSSNCSVKNSTIADIFDSGVSPQTYNSNKTASNFVFENLTITRCGFAGLEIASLYNGGMTNSSIQNVSAKNLNISNCGSGWSGRRYGTEGRGIKIGADIFGGDASRSLSGVIIENCSITNNKGDGVLIGGNSGSVVIKQSLIKNSGGNGILVQEAGNSNIILNLSSSVIDSNTGYGISYNVPAGGGFNVYQNTFYNNVNIAFAIWNHSGAANLVNNIFHAAVYHSVFFYSGLNLSGAGLDHNFFTEFSGLNIIGYNGTPYSDAIDFNSGNSSVAHNNLSGDPLLNADFSLQNASPCKYAGKTGTGISLDKNNSAFHNPPSIGAYEY